ncbi:MAG: hypothetical protein KGI37_00855 [Alphaproteobacteria bacterium]|nr:hypothetical protein [Alphaproteobacteria bacterium]
MIACLALFAMLVPSATFLVHHPAGRLAGMMPNCGMSGMATMAADMQGGPAKPYKTPHKTTPPCPICQSLHIMAGGFVPPDLSAAVLVAPTTGIGIIALPPAVLIARLIAPQARPRAPPFRA